MEEKTLLYIEDNPHNRRIVRKILGTRGYTVVEVEDGLVGYETILITKPPLVLLDIALPTMDGMEIVKRVKEDETLWHIPVIALTASAMRGDRERFLAAGCDDYLSKPVKARELIQMVDNYFPQTNQPELVIESQPGRTEFDAWINVYRNEPPVWNNE
ncbi:MAG: response regulator [Chloroflexi bacterium]|nr:response regulator [Chloroflexota bacterium]